MMENKDIRITLQYNLDEINHLLTLLGTVPFNQSAGMIEHIKLQAVPQLPKVSEKNQEQVEPQ